jgi:hypothetical protein
MIDALMVERNRKIKGEKGEGIDMRDKKGWQRIRRMGREGGGNVKGKMK